MVLEQPDEIVNMPIPQTMTDLCEAWDDWTNGNVVNQIDDGLKMRDSADRTQL